MSVFGDDLAVIFGEFFAEDVTSGSTTGVASIWSQPSDWDEDRHGLVADWFMVQIPVAELGSTTPAKRDVIKRYPGTSSEESWVVDKVMKELGLWTLEVHHAGRVVPR